MLSLTEHLRPGDHVLVGQAVAEPPGLVRQLIEASDLIHDLTAYCGYTMNPAWQDVRPGHLVIRGYIAHGPMRLLAARGQFDVLPWHVTTFESNLRHGRLRVDVVLLQVGPMDEDGYYNLGGTVDYALAAVPHARVVLVEVNTNMPRTASSRRLHRSQVTGSVQTDEPLLQSTARSASPPERTVARHVASLVPDGSCLQVGIGPLADEVVNGLRDHSDLRVRAGIAADWLVDLYEAGVMAPGSGTSLVSMTAGTQRLYDFLDGNDRVLLESVSDLTQGPAEVPLIAVNSAVEVDLTGQVNAEVGGGRYIGGIGAQSDFFRAARSSRDGLAIAALASTHPGGDSRIVATLTGPVTTLRSDVDIVVTEHGAADLRPLSLAERKAALIAIAAPERRESLMASPQQFQG